VAREARRPREKKQDIIEERYLRSLQVTLLQISDMLSNLNSFKGGALIPDDIMEIRNTLYNTHGVEKTERAIMILQIWWSWKSASGLRLKA